MIVDGYEKREARLMDLLEKERARNHELVLKMLGDKPEPNGSHTYDPPPPDLDLPREIAEAIHLRARDPQVAEFMRRAAREALSTGVDAESVAKDILKGSSDIQAW